MDVLDPFARNGMDGGLRGIVQRLADILRAAGLDDELRSGRKRRVLPAGVFARLVPGVVENRVKAAHRRRRLAKDAPQKLLAQRVGVLRGIPHELSDDPLFDASRIPELGGWLLDAGVGGFAEHARVPVGAAIRVDCRDAALREYAEVDGGRLGDGARVVDAATEVVFAPVDVVREVEPAECAVAPLDVGGPVENALLHVLRVGAELHLEVLRNLQARRHREIDIGVLADDEIWVDGPDFLHRTDEEVEEARRAVGGVLRREDCPVGAGEGCVARLAAAGLLGVFEEDGDFADGFGEELLVFELLQDGGAIGGGEVRVRDAQPDVFGVAPDGREHVELRVVGVLLVREPPGDHVVRGAPRVPVGVPDAEPPSPVRLFALVHEPAPVAQCHEAVPHVPEAALPRLAVTIVPEPERGEVESVRGGRIEFERRARRIDRDGRFFRAGAWEDDVAVLVEQAEDAVQMSLWIFRDDRESAVALLNAIAVRILERRVVAKGEDDGGALGVRDDGQLRTGDLRDPVREFGGRRGRRRMRIFAQFDGAFRFTAGDKDESQKKSAHLPVLLACDARDPQVVNFA